MARPWPSNRRRRVHEKFRRSRHGWCPAGAWIGGPPPAPRGTQIQLTNNRNCAGDALSDGCPTVRSEDRAGPPSTGQIVRPCPRQTIIPSPSTERAPDYGDPPARERQGLPSALSIRDFSCVARWPMPHGRSKPWACAPRWMIDFLADFPAGFGFLLGAVYDLAVRHASSLQEGPENHAGHRISLLVRLSLVFLFFSAKTGPSNR